MAREVYELALMINRSIEEIKEMSVEQFNEWRALFLIKAEEAKNG